MHIYAPNGIVGCRLSISDMKSKIENRKSKISFLISIFNHLSFARKIALCPKLRIYNIRSTIYDIRNTHACPPLVRLGTPNGGVHRTERSRRNAIRIMMEEQKESYRKSAQAFTEAKNFLPGGVNSPVRAFGGVDMKPLFIAAAKGSKIYDIDGNEYIDYVGSWGPMISRPL